MEDYKNTKEGKNAASKYGDILHCSRPDPPANHPRMSIASRAKIFSPFAALRGFDDEISNESDTKLLVEKVELSDEEKSAISSQLLQVQKGMELSVRYFVPVLDTSGRYAEFTGTVSSIDPVCRKLEFLPEEHKGIGIEKELPLVVSFDDIVKVRGIGK